MTFHKIRSIVSKTSAVFLFSAASLFAQDVERAWSQGISSAVPLHRPGGVVSPGARWPGQLPVSSF